MMALILDFVGRRFAVPWMQAAANPPGRPVAATPSSLDSFRRLIDPRATIAADRLPTGTGIDALTALALHCHARTACRPTTRCRSRSARPRGGRVRSTVGRDGAAMGSRAGGASIVVRTAIRALRTQALNQPPRGGRGRTARPARPGPGDVGLPGRRALYPLRMDRRAGPRAARRRRGGAMGRTNRPMITPRHSRCRGAGCAGTPSPAGGVDSPDRRPTLVMMALHKGNFFCTPEAGSRGQYRYRYRNCAATQPVTASNVIAIPIPSDRGRVS